MVPFLSVNAEVLPHASPKKSLPFQGRWLGEAETERSCQICDNLSVSLRLPAPLDKGSLGFAQVQSLPL